MVLPHCGCVVGAGSVVAPTVVGFILWAWLAFCFRMVSGLSFNFPHFLFACVLIGSTWLGLVQLHICHWLDLCCGWCTFCSLHRRVVSNTHGVSQCALQVYRSAFHMCCICVDGLDVLMITSVRCACCWMCLCNSFRVSISTPLVEFLLMSRQSCSSWL